jgi:MFS family permease
MALLPSLTEGSIMQASFQPYATLANRTFVGLIIAQFLAAFNDQCIHAAAMFYAIRTDALTEASAISLMPMLFYAPWAIFCTLAGYLADRYSKRSTLVFWKFAEIGITLIALFGFWLGNVWKLPAGPWIVLSTVFLMGLHSAFFVPAKYGVMPEILPHRLLSKGNGVLESTSFLAVILGTVAGGILSDRRLFKGQEEYIGLLLVGLAVIGALASLIIRRMPAANADRPFPGWLPQHLYGPLWQNLKVLIRSRPLALAVLGIAFFTFMVAFMRQTMYMHGETRSPRWDEFHISVIVGTVALGIGLGSPLAGWLSGGKVELGLVPLGALGMATATLVAAFMLDWEPGLVGCIVALGFFVGFYFVPLYALLQHRAPKASKGDLIATSNFINVTGAILASLFFYLVVAAAHWLELTPRIHQSDNFAVGELIKPIEYRNGRPSYFEVVSPGIPPRIIKIGQPRRPVLIDEEPDPELETTRISVDDDLIQVVRGLNPGMKVIVSTYTLELDGHAVVHYRLRAANQPLRPVYFNEGMPRFLFMGASVMTLLVLLILCRMLPDFFIRTILWVRAQGRYHVKVYGIDHLPTDDAAVLATDCHRFQESMHVLACTDRSVRFILHEDEPAREWTPLLRLMARNTGMVVLPGGKVPAQQLDEAAALAMRTLELGEVVALTVEDDPSTGAFERLLAALQCTRQTPIVPVWCGTLKGPDGTDDPKRVRVVIGAALPPTATPAEVRRAQAQLGYWLTETTGRSDLPPGPYHPGSQGALEIRETNPNR